jgi:hypothetical protein
LAFSIESAAPAERRRANAGEALLFGYFGVEGEVSLLHLCLHRRLVWKLGSKLVQRSVTETAWCHLGRRRATSAASGLPRAGTVHGVAWSVSNQALEKVAPLLLIWLGSASS